MNYSKKNKIILFIFVFTLFLFIKPSFVKAVSLPSTPSDIPLTSNGGLIACNNAINILKNYIAQRGYTYGGYLICDTRDLGDGANNKYAVFVLSNDSLNSGVYKWNTGYYDMCIWQFSCVRLFIEYNSTTELFEISNLNSPDDWLGETGYNAFARFDYIRYNSMSIKLATGNFNNLNFDNNTITKNITDLPPLNPYIYQYDNPPMNEYKYDDLTIYLGGYNFNDFDSLYLNAYYCSSYNTVVVENVTTYYSWVQYRYKLLSDRDNRFDYTIVSPGVYRIKVPRKYLFSNSTFANGDFIKYTLTGSINGVSVEFYVSPIYTLSLTSQQVIDIQNEKETILQEQTTSAIDNIDNYLTDTEIADDTFNDFNNYNPLGDMQNSNYNSLMNSIDVLFAVIYDAFTNDNSTSISFTIPFVNHSFSIQSNYIRNNIPSIFVNFLHIFYYGIVGRFVILDLLRIYNLLLEGKLDIVVETVRKGSKIEVISL